MARRPVTDISAWPSLTLEGKAKEMGRMVAVYDQAFKSKVRYYERSVDFLQTVRLKSAAKTSLSGRIEFMVCNASNCLAPAASSFNVVLGP